LTDRPDRHYDDDRKVPAGRTVPHRLSVRPAFTYINPACPGHQDPVPHRCPFILSNYLPTTITSYCFLPSFALFLISHRLLSLFPFFTPHHASHRIASRTQNRSTPCACLARLPTRLTAVVLCPVTPLNQVSCSVARHCGRGSEVRRRQDKTRQDETRQRLGERRYGPHTPPTYTNVAPSSQSHCSSDSVRACLAAPTGRTLQYTDVCSSVSQRQRQRQPGPG
jgi:hypothetical protein